MESKRIIWNTPAHDDGDSCVGSKEKRKETAEMSKLQAFIFISVLSLVALCSNISIPAISDVEPAFARPLFVDEFDKGVLEPGWEWIDPGNDGAKRFGAREGWLEISAVSGNDLWPNANLDAPRLLRPISGDFAIETKLAPPPDRMPQAGGILVWKDEGNFIRFERGTWGHDTVILQKREGDLFQHLGDWFFSGNPLYLRLERRGEKLKALYSANGEGWNECSQFTFRVNDPLRVGMHAVCLGSRTPSTATNFDYFKIFWTGENEPYTASNVRGLEDEELQIRQEAENEKLTERASYVLSKTASERRADSKDVVIDPKTGLKFTRIYSDAKLDVIRGGLVMSPDGRFLFSKSGWVVPLKEGEDPFKPAPEIVGLIRGSWSPDMRKFAFTSRQTGNLFVMPFSPETGRMTGPAKKLVEGIGEGYQIRKSASFPRWSSDGKRIAFSWGKSGNFDIWTIPVEVGTPTQITDDPRWECRPVWSSDGKSIIFLRKRDLTIESTWDVWMVAAEGGTPAKIMEDSFGILSSPNSEWLVCGRLKGGGFQVLRPSDNHQLHIVPPEEVGREFAWSREGNKLLFYKSAHRAHSALKVVPIYGGPSVELGKDVELWASYQNWSSDGKAIVTDGEEGFWIIPAAGGTPEKLKVETKPKLDRYPFLPLSPDLKKFAFLLDDRSSLWIAPVSIAEKRITGPAVKIAEKLKRTRDQYNVSWSSDSKKIAFSSTKGGDADIWTASAGGGDLKRLTDGSEDEIDPVWSPDGKMIAYRRGKAIWVTSASGVKPREVAKKGYDPTWSPDGKEIAFIGGSSYISIMTLATGQVRQVTDLKASVFEGADPQRSSCENLIWSPDGRNLAFLSDIKGRYQVWVVPAAGGKPAELASDDAGYKFYLYWSPDGKKLSYDSYSYLKVGMGAIWEADVGELLSGPEK